MKLSCIENEKGIEIRLRNRKFKLVYPEKIWQCYPKEIKEVLIDNLAHLLTINAPLVAGKKELKYNTSFPLFKYFFNNLVINSLPSAVEDYDIDTEEIIREFLNINYKFNDPCVKMPRYDADLEEKTILSLSCGKDSLLSLATCNEIGLSPTSIYINDTVSPTENKLKMRFGKELAKKFDLKFFIVRNEIEKLNDFEFWNKNESCIGYTHMMTGFSFIALPFSHYYKAKYIVLGNQQNMNFKFYNKDGFLTYPSFDQTREWMRQLNLIMKLMTGGRVSVISVVEPLTNIAITRILHKRYKEFGKFEVSCDCLDASDERRWCHDCPKCARLFLFMRANGIDPKTVGFRLNLFEKRYKKLYRLFDGREIDMYEKSEEAKEEQLLAFYLVYRNKQKGNLIDLFKRKFLEEAKSKEDYLVKKFLSLHKSITMPRKIRKNVLSVFEEELSSFSL